MNSKQRFYQWCYGWTDGAGSRPMSPDKAGSREYCEGYVAGQKSRRDASQEAAIKFGVTNNQVVIDAQ